MASARTSSLKASWNPLLALYGAGRANGNSPRGIDAESNEMMLPATTGATRKRDPPSPPSHGRCVSETSSTASSSTEEEEAALLQVNTKRRKVSHPTESDKYLSPSAAAMILAHQQQKQQVLAHNQQQQHQLALWQAAQGMGAITPEEYAAVAMVAQQEQEQQQQILLHQSLAVEQALVAEQQLWQQHLLANANANPTNHNYDNNNYTNTKQALAVQTLWQQHLLANANANTSPNDHNNNNSIVESPRNKRDAPGTTMMALRNQDPPADKKEEDEEDEEKEEEKEEEEEEEEEVQFVKQQQAVVHKLKWKWTAPPVYVACLNLGREFLPQHPSARKKYRCTTRLCDCGLALCHEIGFPNRGTMAFPDEDDVETERWCHAVGIYDEDKIQAIRTHPTAYTLAYWHFPRHQRHFDMETGCWILKDGNNNSNSSSKEEILPNAHLQTFVDYCRRGNHYHKTMMARQHKHMRHHPGSSHMRHHPGAPHMRRHPGAPPMSPWQRRPPSLRMQLLHRQWCQNRRPPTLDP